MAKDGERAYLAAIGEDGRRHSLLKPFSDPTCGTNLASIAVIMSLLPEPPARILDLGCGGAWTSVFYALRGYRVTGQDIAPDMIDLAIENRDRHDLSPDQLDFICGDYEALADADGGYDCAIFFDSLHHSDDEGKAIRSAFDALKPGGILLTHEPGEGHAMNPFSIAAIEQFGVNERDMPPELIVQRGLEAGFKSYRVLPMPADLFHIFYEARFPRRRFSKARLKIIRRLHDIIFKPNMKNGAIVLLQK